MLCNSFVRASINSSLVNNSVSSIMPVMLLYFTKCPDNRSKTSLSGLYFSVITQFILNQPSLIIVSTPKNFLPSYKMSFPGCCNLSLLTPSFNNALYTPSINRRSSFVKSSTVQCLLILIMPATGRLSLFNKTL